MNTPKAPTTTNFPRSFPHFVFALCWLLMFGATGLGQEGPVAEGSKPCSRSAQQIREFHGLHLGMTEREVRQLFHPSSKYKQPGVFDDATQHLHLCIHGCKNAADREHRVADKGHFKGIAEVHFTFERELLTQLTVYFRERAMPADMAEFSSQVATELGISGQWRSNPYLATISCAGFRLRIEGKTENKLALIATEKLP